MVPALGYFAKTMKILAIISLVIGLLGLGAGLYCQFEVVPSVKSAERFSRTMSYDDPAYAAARGLTLKRYDLKFNLGTTAMVAGGLGLLGGIFAGIKKAKLGWPAAAVSLPALVLGLLQATHMFS